MIFAPLGAMGSYAIAPNHMTSTTVPSSNSKPLGASIHIFRHRQLGWLEALTLMLPGGLAVLLPLFYGYGRARFGTERFGVVAAEQWSRPWYLLACIAFIVFLLVAIIRIRDSSKYIAVHIGGLRLNLGNNRSLSWEQIAGVSTETVRYEFLGIKWSPRMRGVIFPSAGKPIRLTNAIQDLPELLSILKARLYPRLYPDLQANLHNGQWLHFGPLAIQRKGIKFLNHIRFKQEQPIPWSQVTHVDVNSGFLVVELSDQPRLKLPVSQIPNIELLIQLIQLGVNS
jgi:hypothetical protein